MFVEATPSKAKFCELVEHPGGHDGGEFPQYTEFGVADDGSAFFSTGYPECPNDTFCADEPEDFLDVENHEEATELLRRHAAKLREQAKALDELAEKYTKASEFVVYFDEEVHTP